MNQGFSKSERICSKRIIDQLFGGGNASMAAYPLRAVYMTENAEDSDNSGHSDYPENMAPFCSVLISVPKRRLRHAVDRNRLKRQVREAYRLNKHPLLLHLAQQHKRLYLAFVCIADAPVSSSKVTQSVLKILHRVMENV